MPYLQSAAQLMFHDNWRKLPSISVQSCCHLGILLSKKGHTQNTADFT